MDLTTDETAKARLELVSIILAVFALLTLLKLGLLTALLAGLLIYHLVHLVTPALGNMGVTHSLRKTVALTILVALITLLLALGVIKLMNTFNAGLDGIVELLKRMAEVVDTAKARLPAWVQAYLPDNTADMQTAVAGWLRSHASELGTMGVGAGRFVFYLIIGIVIGGLIAIQTTGGRPPPGPLAMAFIRRARFLSIAFRNIVFSQILISALNTTFTALYLAVVLPLFDVHLPLVKTMIAVTFIAGLLPVLGNLISNTVIFIVSLSVSPAVAIAALTYLVVIHKLEYFLNARIIGGRINARAWELLIAMMSMEAAFGVPGLVAAPIYYAYLKEELYARSLI